MPQSLGRGGLALSACLLALGMAACARSPATAAPAVDGSGETVAARWERAERLWRRRDPRAHAHWVALPPGTPAGERAHRRLREANGHYREGIRRLRTGAPRVREALERGVGVAPMDPALYLPLARACRARGLELRAAEYYNKFLAARPDAPQADEARGELHALAPELAGVFEPLEQADPPAGRRRRAGLRGERQPWPWLPLGFGALGGLGLALAIGGVVRARGRGVSLPQLAEQAPELHPAIAYLVGSLRHELLKHRVGAAGDAVAALRRGDATGPQLAFLRSRLFGGEPLRQAWEGHERAFARALGHRLDLRRDRVFRDARRAVRRIAALEPALAAGDGRAADELARQHARLRELDRVLSDLVGSLVRTTVDRDLLADVVAQVRAEHVAGGVSLDALQVVGPDEPVAVEVFRVDLVLVLKNVLRNAIVAVGRGGPPRRVRMDVDVQLEPTGEETVRIRVRDTSRETLRPEDLRERRVDRGLGLVAAAVDRYRGAVEVEPGGEGWQKAVTIRFFRALDDDRLQEGRALAA